MREKFAASLLVLGVTLASQAGAGLQFDTQGNGTFIGQAGPVIDIDAFDWAQNSFLARGGVEAIVNYGVLGDACGTACEFTVYTQGVLNSATLGGAPVWGGRTFGDDQVEVTFTLSFTERVTATDFATGQSDFAVVTAGPVVFEMYFDTTPDAQAISGSGYSDGTLILFGDEILDSTGFYSSNLDELPEDLDQSGTNDYDGQLTLSGNGSQGAVEIGGLVQDSNFFLDSLQAFGFNFSNLSFENPFTNVNPADCYNGTSNGGVDGANVGNVIAANGCNTAHIDGTFEQNEAGATGLVPRTGTVNGLPVGTYGGQDCNPTTCPDFVAQTDSNSGVQVEVVPTPGTLAIAGLGLLLLGARRRNNKV